MSTLCGFVVSVVEWGGVGSVGGMGSVCGVFGVDVCLCGCVICVTFSANLLHFFFNFI